MTQKNTRAALASKEHYVRMQALGYKKYSMLLKAETIAKIDMIAEQLSVPKYQLIDKILNDFVEAIKKSEL